MDFIKAQTHTLWLGLGGNIGKTRQRFESVVADIQILSCRPLRMSPLYLTEAWGGIRQPAFLNQVVELEIRSSPIECLHWMQHLETKYGRNRCKEIPWGPRPIDIDLLSWTGPAIRTYELIMPHLHLSKRRFVLQPFSDIAPDHVPAGYSESIREMLELCTDEKLTVYQS